MPFAAEGWGLDDGIPSERLIELTKRLKAATDAGQLEWTAEETQLSLDRAHGAVGVRSRDGDGEALRARRLRCRASKGRDACLGVDDRRTARSVERNGGTSLPCGTASGARRRQDSRGPPRGAPAPLGRDRFPVQAVGLFGRSLDRALETLPIPRAFVPHPPRAIRPGEGRQRGSREPREPRVGCLRPARRTGASVRRSSRDLGARGDPRRSLRPVHPATRRSSR